jgi:uncharacterized protein YigE (DUF2233 family)
LKDNQGQFIHNFRNLKTYVESQQKTLLFAVNGGMYQKDFSPQGLYIENQKQIQKIDHANGGGNFYLKPNGIFYLTMNQEAKICKTENFKNDKHIKYATQSGPMLVIDGQIHPAFIQGSSNVNIRNGVGILPNHQIIFAMSKKEINFYDFAEFFKNLGCQQALYLDGFVSRTYLPEKNWIQEDGNFGVIIGWTKAKNGK